MTLENNWSRLPVIQRDEFTAVSDTPEQQQQLDRVFDLFDSDRDGRIVAGEIGAALTSLHGQRLTKKELKRILASADLDSNGYVDRSEFARIVAKGSRQHKCRSSKEQQQQRQRQPPLSSENDLARAFRIFDADRDGFIAPAELRSALIRLLPPGEVTDELVVEMISGADLDGDGRVSFAEFVRIVRADEVRYPMT